jgi:hypothetical protein
MPDLKQDDCYYYVVNFLIGVNYKSSEKHKTYFNAIRKYFNEQEKKNKSPAAIKYLFNGREMKHQPLKRRPSNKTPKQ